MLHIFNKYYPWRKLLFFFGEGLLIFLVINAVFISYEGIFEFQNYLFFNIIKVLVVTFVFQLCFYYSDLYDLNIIPVLSDHVLKVIQTFGLGCIVLALIYYLFPLLSISTRFFWPGLLGVGAAVFVWRFCYFRIIERRMFVQPIVLVGAGSYAGEIVDAIENKKDSGFKVEAMVAGENNSAGAAGRIPVFPDMKNLEELCAKRKIGKIVVALDERRGISLHELIRYKFLGIEILDGARFYESLTGRVPVKRINPSWFVFSDGFHVGRWKKMLKRAFDVSASSVMLVVCLPVFAASALIIKLDSRGPVFYRQVRVGENGKVFEIIKFRSMREDAEEDGPAWAAADDRRVTRSGRFMRKSRIDELPQLLNVLKGDMSFVGPRPERPVFVERLMEDIPFYGNRHHVKPGITGWAQINYPYGASVEDALRKLEYDLYYIKNLSIGIDLLTIFGTVKVVLLQKGAH